MAISIVNSAANQTAPSGTTKTLDIDVGSYSNRLLLVSVASSNSQGQPTGVTYNSVAMTKIDGYTDGGYALSVWYLANPTAGSNTITASFSGSDTYGSLVAVALSGAKQTSPVNTYGTDGYSNDWTDRGASVTTTVDGCAVINFGYMDNRAIVAGDANSVEIIDGYFYTTTGHGAYRKTTFPQTSAGAEQPIFDGGTNSWGRSITVAIEPATYTDVSTDLSTNLVSYWELEETSGTRYDSHGSNDLTDNNTVLYATGIQGNGADFTDSNSEYLSRADGSLSGLKPTTALTLSAWFKLDSTPGLDTIFAKNWNTSWSPPYASYHLRIDDATHITFLTAHGSSTNYYFLQPTVSTISASTWYHVALVFDSTTLKGYLNGVEVGSMSAPNDIAYSTGEFQIGRSATGEYFNGVIDEAGVWSRALSAGEVAALYNGGSGIPYSAPASTSIKSVNGLAIASVKSKNGLAIASIKSINGLSNVS